MQHIQIPKQKTKKNKTLREKSVKKSLNNYTKSFSCPCGGGCSRCKKPIQAKLKVNQPNDPYEQEADRVTSQIMRMPTPNIASTDEPQIQQKCSSCDMEEDELKISRKTAGIGGIDVSDDFSSQLNSSGGHALDSPTQSFMESRFEYDFSDVRIHNDSKADKLARSVNALAFTVGNDVFLGQNESVSNKKLMAHELTHVVQQQHNTLIQRQSLDNSQNEFRNESIISLANARVLILKNKLNLVSAYRTIAEKSVPENVATTRFRTNSLIYEKLLHTAINKLQASADSLSFSNEFDDLGHQIDQTQFYNKADLIHMGIASFNMYVAGLRSTEAAFKDKLPTPIWPSLAFRTERMGMGVEATLQQFHKPVVDINLVIGMRIAIKTEIEITEKVLDAIFEGAKISQKWWKKIRVPLSFIEGLTIPWYGMIAMGTIHAGEFYKENSSDLKLVKEYGKVWINDLQKIKESAPKFWDKALKVSLLEGNLSAFIEGIGTDDIAFLIGRVVRGSILSPDLTIGAFLKIILSTAAIISVIRGPKFIAKRKLELAIEFANDIKDDLRKLNPNLNDPEIREIAEELLQPQNIMILKQLSISSAKLSESLSRIVQAALVSGFSATKLPKPEKILDF